MKRFFCLLCLSLLLLLFTACGSSKTIGATYEGSISFTDGSTDCTAKLSADGDTLTLSVTSPENIAGIGYTFRDGELHTTLNGLECITPDNSLPSGAVPRLIYELFSRAQEAQYQSSENGIDTFVLQTDGGDMTVTAMDGVPQTLLYGNRTVRFS